MHSGKRVPGPALRVVAVDALDGVAAVAVVACVGIMSRHAIDATLEPVDFHTGPSSPRSSRTSSPPGARPRPRRSPRPRSLLPYLSLVEQDELVISSLTRRKYPLVESVSLS